MARQDWTIDELRAELESRRSRLKGWVIHQEHMRRRERYFLLDGGALAVDQDRDARVSSVSVKLLVRLADAARQGEILKRLSSHQAVAPQLDAAIEAALQTEHQAWELPARPPAELARIKSADPRVAEDIDAAMEELTSRIRLAVAQERPTRFSSAEAFVSIHDKELWFSNGFRHRASQSRIYAEAAYSMSPTTEYLATRWSVSLDDLDVEGLFDEASDRARASLEVGKPETGRYPVIVDAEVLSTLLNGHMTQLLARNAYQRLPFVKPGEALIPGAIGDLLSIRLNPSLDYGADAVAVSDHGEGQRPLELVRDNVVVATASDKQYSDYLGIPCTTVRGDLEVEPGSLAASELALQAPRVLEILQFSGLFTDPNSGTFASEIRLARLHDNARGRVTYVKGGSLSGSILENFKGARFSRERVRRAHFSSDAPHGEGYFGPRLALLNDVSIVG